MRITDKLQIMARLHAHSYGLVNIHKRIANASVSCHLTVQCYFKVLFSQIIFFVLNLFDLVL